MIVETKFLFDTEVFVEAHGSGARKAAIEALDTMSELHQKLDKFSTGSDIFIVNSLAGGKPSVDFYVLGKL